MNKYLSKICSLLDTHGLFKKLNKKELKFLNKSEITEGLQSSTQNIYSKFPKWKNKIVKEFYRNNYKNYKNLSSTLLKRAKQKYFIKFFKENITDIKNTWKRYKNFSTNEAKKKKSNDTPSLITKDEKYINDPVSIANILNNFFTSVAKIIHSKIPFSNKSFKNFLSSEINGSFSITSNTKEEIYKTKSSLNSNKYFEPNSISAKVLHLLQDQIPNNLATVCNLSFSTETFPCYSEDSQCYPHPQTQF